MKLKRLEILGFKTFKEKTVLDFSTGISGIVGPNGCGKSNIVDALRWVMGEQNARLLRGKRMEDVIFAGSEEAPAVNMAEVSIILTNDGSNFPPEFAEFNEVMITRKAFREEEGEYYINKIPCRLLDIKEFFMDTGIGARTYSLVEQNSVMGLVEAKPEERRQFIEEAAGIIKYKTRKESAFRKMESTKQNILRLNDIVREVRLQLNSVTRQAKRAEKYKNIRKEVREAELALSLERHCGLAERKSSLEAAWEDLQSREQETKSLLGVIEARLEELKAGILESSEADLQEKLYNLKNAINSAEQEISFSKRKMEELSLQKQRSILELDMLREKRSGTEAEIASLRAALADDEESAAGLRGSIAEAQDALESRRQRERELSRSVEDRKSAALSLASEAARHRNMLSALEKGLDDIHKRTERSERELGGNRDQLLSVGKMLDGIAADLEADARLLSDAASREKEALEGLDAARGRRRDLEEEITAMREELGVKSSRLLSLKEIQEGHTWCGEAARSILNADSSRELSCAKIFGVVADHLDVPPDYETAVESVLGEKLQYMVVHAAEDGLQAIDYLKKNSVGRGSFVPAGEVRGTSAGLKDAELSEAVRLMDVIRIRDDFRGVADYLLGDVLLIPNLQAGVSMWRKNGFAGTLVTKEGDLISPHGVLTGGNGAGGESGMLRKKREMAELETDIAGITERLRSASEEKDLLDGSMESLENEVAAARGDLKVLEIRVSTRRKDIERYENEKKWIEQRIHALELDCEHLRSEAAQALESIESHRKEAAVCEERSREASAEIAELADGWEEFRSGLLKAERELTEKRVSLASLEEKVSAGRKSVERLEADGRSVAAAIEGKAAETESCDNTSAELAERTAQTEEKLRSLYAEYEAGETDLRNEREARQEKEAGLSAQEAEAREVRRKIDEAAREAAEVRMELHRTALEMDSLGREVQEKHHEDIAALAAGFQGIDGTRRDEILQRLEANRKTLDDFGEVNLLAIEEHEQLKERYEFLVSQVNDLNASLDTLQRTISRINRISRKRFAEAFEAVNDTFKEVFPKLFPGGRGELRLTESPDVLEAGVEVMVQVPGKKTQNITLLSGGEKSLVAIALIFAIILYRPTPFLILDEVDAALDDSNISLFNRLVKDISARSQIILVTHNKKSMEISDNLYGITMERQGISTSVSVNLN